MITEKELGERKAAREILTIIEAICLSEAYRDYRINRGEQRRKRFGNKKY